MYLCCYCTLRGTMSSWLLWFIDTTARYDYWLFPSLRSFWYYEYYSSGTRGSGQIQLMYSESHVFSARVFINWNLPSTSERHPRATAVACSGNLLDNHEQELKRLLVSVVGVFFLDQLLKRTLSAQVLMLAHWYFRLHEIIFVNSMN